MSGPQSSIPQASPTLGHPLSKALTLIRGSGLRDNRTESARADERSAI
jgi:hypothetical protein